ncbi:restriction endonuclease [Burkholderia cepacia]|uniref:restriction endonuclease n=1 Tax=Burkholderia cepacia TaxID=292 RepID=UPI002FE2D3A8
MGAVLYDPGALSDGLHETIGYKAGLAVSVPDLCDLLSGSPYPDILLKNEEHYVRLRSEDVVDLYYQALYKVGYTDEPFDGDTLGLFVLHKYADYPDELAGVTQLMLEWLPKMMDIAEKTGTKSMDPSPLLTEAYEKYGYAGFLIAYDRVNAMATGHKLNPFFSDHQPEWLDRLDLSELKTRSEQAPTHGSYFDQRFINFLANNSEKVGEMHWRRFEQLTAEFFHRAGFMVEIGAGGNDDGVDIRAWAEGAETADAPTCIVQCKRQKDKIDKVTVKGLAADVTYNGATYGVIVTSAELSMGAREVVKVRGYPIKEVNADKVATWLGILRAPGTGIVRV